MDNWRADEVYEVELYVFDYLASCIQACNNINKLTFYLIKHVESHN